MRLCTDIRIEGALDELFYIAISRDHQDGTNGCFAVSHKKTHESKGHFQTVCHCFYCQNTHSSVLHAMYIRDLLGRRLKLPRMASECTNPWNDLSAKCFCTLCTASAITRCTIVDQRISPMVLSFHKTWFEEAGKVIKTSACEFRSTVIKDFRYKLYISL